MIIINVNKLTITLTLLLVSFICFIFFGNHYKMSEQKVIIPTTFGNLSAVLTTPKNKQVKGSIIFVHGDGAQSATQDGGYKPLMERFAKQGYVSITWDKPGVGKSTGNWLEESMDDRSSEVNQVINWLKENYPDQTLAIGLWGASQAGWVIPKVMNQNPLVKFSLLVSPAINWKRQGAYDTGWRIKQEGGTLTDQEKAKKDFLEDSKLIEAHSSYSGYKAAGGTESFSKARYSFIHRNIPSDVTEDLKKLDKKLFLILAEKDKNVDISETKKVYMQQMNPNDLTISTIPNVEHQMLRPFLARNGFLMNFAAIIAPKYLLIDTNYLDESERFLKKYSENSLFENEKKEKNNFK